MDWINLHIPSVLRSVAFIGSSPGERGTWLCVLAYACEIECGGRLIGGATWKERQWQQSCGVTLREVRLAWKLLQVDGEDVVVNGYPNTKEQHVQQARGAGKAGAMARWSRQNGDGERYGERHRLHMANANGARMATAMANANAEGEGKEKGKGKDTAIADGMDPEDLTSPRPETTADRVAFGLGTWVRWHAKEIERERENLDELGALVGKYGVAIVQAACERFVAREHRKVWPNELLPEILGPKAIEPEQPRRAEILRMISESDWIAIRSSLGLPEKSCESRVELVDAVFANGYLFDDLIAKHGAG